MSHYQDYDITIESNNTKWCFKIIMLFRYFLRKRLHEYWQCYENEQFLSVISTNNYNLHTERITNLKLCCRYLMPPTPPLIYLHTSSKGSTLHYYIWDLTIWILKMIIAMQVDFEWITKLEILMFKYHTHR